MTAQMQTGCKKCINASEQAHCNVQTHGAHKIPNCAQIGVHELAQQVAPMQARTRAEIPSATRDYVLQGV